MGTAPETNPPRVLYKYRPVDIHLIRMLVMGEIYFGNPLTDFNDPYDTRIDILGQNHTGRPMWGILREDMTRPYSGKVTVSGVYCLSEKSDDILMFSHYAAGHRGVCVGVDTTRVNKCAMGHEPDKAVVGGGAPFWAEVEYADDLGELLRSKDPDVMRNLLWTKPASWRYEKEWRLVDPGGSGHRVIQDDTIVELILGSEISQEDRRLVLALMERFRPGATIFQAQIAKSAFRIETVSIPRASAQSRDTD